MPGIQTCWFVCCRCASPMRKSNSNAVLDFAQKDVAKEETFRVLTASLPLGLSDLVHWLRPKPAELAPFLSGANNCPSVKALQPGGPPDPPCF